MVYVRRTNQLDGHVNLRDAAHGRCGFKDPKTGKDYTLKEKVCLRCPDITVPNLVPHIPALQPVQKPTQSHQRLNVIVPRTLCCLP